MNSFIRYGLVATVLGAGAWCLGLPAQEAAPKAASKSDPKKANSKQADPKLAEAELAASKVSAAIKATGDEFVKAYNAHDAKALSALFVPEALIYDEDAKRIVGREEIEAAFASVFKATPKAQMELAIHSIDTLGKGLAVEVGTSQTTSGPGAVLERSRYVVLHVERDGKWGMALVRDMPDEPTSQEHLLPLAWLVGDWIDESRAGRVSTSCKWDESRNFLLQDITIGGPGSVSMRITQRIGWDPLTKRIKSWVFDSEGGYGESFWTRTETGWLIKATGVRPDGTAASSTNSIVMDGFDAYGYRSVDRVVSSNVEPDIEVRVVRHPPEPASGK